MRALLRRLCASMLAFGLTTATGCREKPQDMVTHVHPNGIKLSVPATLPLGGAPAPLTVTPTAAGFYVALGADIMRRRKTEASVAFNQSAVPAGAWPFMRDIDGRRIAYRIDQSEGGSGGSHFELRAWEARGGGYLLYVQSDQAGELDGADFSLAWTVITGVHAP